MFNLAQAQDKYAQALDSIDKCIRLAGPDTPAGLSTRSARPTCWPSHTRRHPIKATLPVRRGLRKSVGENAEEQQNVLNNLAYMLAQSDQRLVDALAYAKTAVEQSPDVAGHQDTYGYVLYKNGRHAEAAEALAAAIQQYEAGGAVPVDVYEHLGMVDERWARRARPWPPIVARCRPAASGRRTWSGNASTPRSSGCSRGDVT